MNEIKKFSGFEKRCSPGLKNEERNFWITPMWHTIEHMNFVFLPEFGEISGISDIWSGPHPS